MSDKTREMLNEATREWGRVAIGRRLADLLHPGPFVAQMIGDPSASAWQQASAAQIEAMQNAAVAHNQIALDAMMNAADRGNMQWRRPPGIYWTRQTNRQSTVEIVR